MMKNRDVTIDVMKGIAILAMIAGHCFIPLRLHHFIYMWHMPLFFFVSGYFFKDKPLGKTVYGIWKGLLVPYLVVAAFILLCMFCSDSLWGTDLLKSRGVALFAVNGLLAAPEAYGGLYKCGPIWFLLALGWCKLAYGILAKLRLNMIVETLSLAVLSYLIVRYHEGLYMPFFMLQAFASLVFYHAGYLFKRNMPAIAKHRRMALALGVTALAVGMWRGSMSIWALWFSNWTLNTCAAIGSVVSLYFVLSSRYFAPPIIVASGISSKVMGYLAHIGRLSILVLALHSIENILELGKRLFEMQNIIPLDSLVCRGLTILCQFLFCLLGLYIVERNRWIRKIFNVK